jgi:hypothetical protein
MNAAPVNPWLIAGAVCSALAAALHLGCIVFGASWYRFFGAGERMARMAEAGHPYPAIVTLAIAVVLAVWSCYALAAAGVLGAPPLLRAGVVLITAVFLVRGIGAIPLVALLGAPLGPFWWWSSAICLGIGLLHLAGLLQVWERL